MTSPIRLLITGSLGRMGQAVFACAKKDTRFSITELPTRHDSELGSSFSTALTQNDVTIDFTQPVATLSFVEASARAGKPLVIGTTGHTETMREAIAHHARTIPIILAPNFSIGVNTLFWLARKTSEILGPEFDLEIVEMHHRQKKDAPSGTACRLAEILAESRRSFHSATTNLKHGREGLVGTRPTQEIGIHAVRGGDIVGDHTVLFAGEGERLELTHRASSRITFALGSLRAAVWILQQPPGLYNMQDVLGLD